MKYMVSATYIESMEAHIQRENGDWDDKISFNRKINFRIYSLILPYHIKYICSK